MVARRAFSLAELNYIHPFRKENGRTLREFMRLLYDQVDYDMHWDAVSPEVLLQAMRIRIPDDHAEISTIKVSS